MTDNSITIKRSSISDATEATINHLNKLINDVYDIAEDGMWKVLGERSKPALIEEMLRNEQMFLAEIEGQIVGSVKIDHMDDDVCEFGMLVADPTVRSKGIGRLLVQRCENHARENGFKTMRLELLTPREWENPSKEFLKKWYTRLGYKPTITEPFEKHFPERITSFACLCDYTIWLKEL